MDFKKADHDAAAADDDSKSSIGSFSEDSSMNSVMTLSLSSSLSESTEETADSSITTSSSSSLSKESNGPLYELSQLMNHLPIKRGLSMFYEGKTQSFSSLATVESIGDLPKKVTPYNYRKKMKSSKSYAEDLDRSQKVMSHIISPKATISKKTSRGGSMVSALSSRRGSFLGGSGLSTIAVHKNF